MESVRARWERIDHQVEALVGARGKQEPGSFGGSQSEDIVIGELYAEDGRAFQVA
jgi:hypothetical protein